MTSTPEKALVGGFGEAGGTTVEAVSTVCVAGVIATSGLFVGVRAAVGTGPSGGGADGVILASGSAPNSEALRVGAVVGVTPAGVTLCAATVTRGVIGGSPIDELFCGAFAEASGAGTLSAVAFS